MSTHFALLFGLFFMLVSCSSGQKSGDAPQPPTGASASMTLPGGNKKAAPHEAATPKPRVSPVTGNRRLRFVQHLQKHITSLSFQLVASGVEAKYIEYIAMALPGRFGLSPEGVVLRGAYRGFFVEKDTYKALGQSTSRLSVYLVAPVATHSDRKAQEKAWRDAREALTQLFATVGGKDPVPLPDGYEVGFQKDVVAVPGATAGKKVLRAMLLQRAKAIVGTDIERTEIAYAKGSLAPTLNLTLAEKAGARMEKLTGRHHGWKLAMSLDGWIFQAPVIQTRISRHVQITAP